MNSTLAVTDPNAIGGAASWLQSALIGSVATSVAIIAVGWLGLMLIAGRLPSRRAAQLVLGCFIIFGANRIAAGIVRGLRSSGAEALTAPMQASPFAATPVIGPRVKPKPVDDQYRGAAM